MKSAPNSPAAEQWIPFDNWLSQFGRTRQTGHRWRQQLPWLQVRNILGRVYISAESARRFAELAASGALAIHHSPPPPPPPGSAKKKEHRPAMIRNWQPAQSCQSDFPEDDPLIVKKIEVPLYVLDPRGAQSDDAYAQGKEEYCRITEIEPGSELAHAVVRLERKREASYDRFRQIATYLCVKL